MKFQARGKTALLIVAILIIAFPVPGCAISKTFSPNQAKETYELELNKFIGGANYVARSGDWVFYINESDNSLYKINTQKYQKMKLTNKSDPTCIYVVGDWIYYIDHAIVKGKQFTIFKIRTDGTNKTQINDDGAHDMIVAGNDIFYIGDRTNLYKIHTDGSGKTKIAENIIHYVVDGDWIYYPNVEDSGKLYKMKTDGSTAAKINDDEPCYSMTVADGWIYYSNASDKYKLYKTRADGSGRTKLSDDLTGNIAVDGDWIYYKTYDSMSVYKISTEGTGRELLLDNFKTIFLGVVDGWIFLESDINRFFTDSDKYGRFFALSSDGSKIKAVDRDFYWEPAVDGSQSTFKSRLVLADVTQEGFNFKLYAYRYKEEDGSLRISEDGFDGKAVFKDAKTATFKEVDNDNFGGTITFDQQKLHITYDHPDLYYLDPGYNQRAKLLYDFYEVDDVNYNSAGLEKSFVMPYSPREPAFGGKELFWQDSEDILSLFGQPDSQELTDETFDIETWTYDKLQLEMMEYTDSDTQQSKFYLLSIKTDDPNIIFLRGTKVGDRLEDVVAKFHNLSKADLSVSTEPEVILYGTPEHMQTFGIINYKNGKPVKVYYLNEGAWIIYHIVDNKVQSIEASYEYV